jgi:hypothetical protein
MPNMAEVLANPYLVQKCASFIQQTQAFIPASNPAVCLLQGECAYFNFGVGPHKKQPFAVGSQDATTCIIIILSCSETGNMFVAHMDTHELSLEDTQVLMAAIIRMQNPKLYLAGGYCDQNGLGPMLSQSILSLFHSQISCAIHLELACIAQLNTAEDGSPKTRQLVLHPDDQLPRPCLFTSRGPCVARRFACQHCR